MMKEAICFVLVLKLFVSHEPSCCDSTALSTMSTVLLTIKIANHILQNLKQIRKFLFKNVVYLKDIFCILHIILLM